MIDRISEGPFLGELFGEWQRAGFRYAVLRDFEHLPDSTGGHDLDLLVDREDLESMVRLACHIAEKHGGGLIAGYRQSGFLARFAGRSSGWWGIAIDFFSELSFRGLPYHDARATLERRVWWRGIPVVAVPEGTMIAFLKEFLHNGADRKGYLAGASRTYSLDPVHWHGIFEESFGMDGSRLLVRLLSSETPGADESLEQLASDLRQCLRRHHWWRNPGAAWWRQWNNRVGRWRRLFSPPGFMLVILGTDGSGKSALIAILRETLTHPLHGAIHVRHWRPGWLPTIAALTKGTAPQGPVTAPHRSTPSGWLGSMVRLGYYSCDFVFGYWLRVFPERVSRPCLTIFDRYFYDFLVDPRRSRVALPSWIIRIIGTVVPRPDLVFCLGTDPEIIHARKPELPRDEIARQVERLRRWQGTMDRAHWLDTGSSIEKVHDAALTILLQAMSSRMNRRHESLFKQSIGR
ncbi:MAG: hypothetical protein H7829_02190 [Magnetococcus sp. THC-1_WYH]